MVLETVKKEREALSELKNLIFTFQRKDIKPSEEELRHMYSLCDKLEIINPRYGKGIGTYRQAVALLVKDLPDGVMI